MTLEALVGRRLMFGLPGPDLSDADIRLFRETQAAGIATFDGEVQPYEVGPVQLDEEQIGRFLAGKTVMVTGAPLPASVIVGVVVDTPIAYRLIVFPAVIAPSRSKL